MMSRIARVAWLVLAYNIGVILWGAYVRATGSGAGCGSHWPLCNGDVIPRAPSAATLIEYSHRLTSGVALASVVVLAVWTWRARGRGHPARTGAGLSLFFMLTEAAVGAGLVLFALVADNASMARALFMAVHLLNTFLLLAALSLTAWWLSGGEPLSLRGRAKTATAVAIGCAAILLVSTSGAVAALGDTLFPQGTLAEALRADLSPTSHVLIRLRMLHPAIAVVVAFALWYGAPRLARGTTGLVLGRAVRGLVALQIAAGAANVLLLAPVWLQAVHLLIADVLWITFVLLGASALGTTHLRGVAASVGRPDLRPPVSDIPRTTPIG